LERTDMSIDIYKNATRQIGAGEHSIH
jgi:hypothetical protein